MFFWNSYTENIWIILYEKKALYTVRNTSPRTGGSLMSDYYPLSLMLGHTTHETISVRVSCHPPVPSPRIGLVPASRDT